MPPEEQPPHPHLRDIILRHPIVSFVIVIAILGVVIVALQSGAVPSAGSASWGTGNIMFSNGSALRTQATQTTSLSQPDILLGAIPLPPQSQDDEGNPTDDGLAALLALISTPQKSAPPGDTSNPFAAYSFIPSGFISASASFTAKTPQQAALFAYGNELGGTIQGFESLHGNSVEILKGQAEDRTNAGKAAAVQRLGEDFVQLSSDLKVMEPPSAAAGYHSAFANAYAAVGNGLIQIAAASGDQAFLDAVGAYNTSVEKLSKSFFAFATFFSVNSVSFSSSDPGSVFMFTP